MDKSTNKIQDLQVFLSRTSGPLPMVGGHQPTLLSTGPTREFASAPVSGTTFHVESSDEFPAYIAVANSEAVESIQLPFDPEHFKEFLQRFSHNSLSIRECIGFGARLFDAIFNRSIRDQLRRLMSEGPVLRLTIATSAPELLVFPWELLCDTQFGMLPRFLCQRREIRLSRSLRLFNRANFEDAAFSKNTLRIMLVTASPQGLPPIDNEKEESILRFVLDEPPALDGIELHVLHGATVNELRKRLYRIKPHIVHVSCHGLFDRREGLGHLALCSESSQTDMDIVNAFRFASLLHEPNSVRMVFLSTCHGAAQDPTSAFSGLAECLHANGISAVVALQFSLKERTAHSIALNLYRHLLRDQMSVEDSVTRIRQYLFLNNHGICECFGLALFQDNCSLSWRPDVGDPNKLHAEPHDDAEYVQAFEDAVRQKMSERLSTVLDRITGKFSDLDSLTTADLGLVLNVFGNDDVGLDILRDVRRAGIPFTPFLKMAKLASVLCQATYEQEQVTTSLLLYAPTDPNAYIEGHKASVSEKLQDGFFWGELKSIVGCAIQVNGTDRAFAALTSQGSHEITHEHIQSLKGIDDGSVKGTVVMGHPKWKRIFAATEKCGCAFILPERSRIKVIVQGEQVAEYRGGKWSYASLAILRDKLPALAEESGIRVDLLIDAMQKAMVASDLGSGRILLLQQKEDDGPRLAPGYKSVLEVEGANELKTQSIIEIEPVEYLKLIEGDGAAVISCEGMTLAVNAKLIPSPNTRVDEIVSSGTRHLSAQKITKESATVAFVVSDDGPVTIFFRGTPFFRKA